MTTGWSLRYSISQINRQRSPHSLVAGGFLAGALRRGAAGFFAAVAWAVVGLLAAGFFAAAGLAATVGCDTGSGLAGLLAAAGVPVGSSV